MEIQSTKSTKSGAVVNANRTIQWHQSPLQIGEAISTTILLSDWDKFGLSERVCYHFDLIETLTASSSIGNEAERAEISTGEERNTILPPPEGPVCGVASLLECVPKTAKYRRRDVRSHILSFNMHAQQVREESQVACFEPSHLPLRLSPATRVWFAYELTKVAFCIDASPTLVSTFGNGLGLENEACCALDRLQDMASIFFKSLVKPITAPWLANPKGWRPILAVTVLAVYPNEVGASDTSILVRDFRVHDVASAELLSKEIARWVVSEVEDEIATRMGHTRTGGITSWNRPPPSSSLRDIFDAGDVALSLLPSRARPTIVLATDCRSVACESILDLFKDPERVDTPLIVLDLSSPSSHSPEVDVADSLDRTSFLTHDPGSSTSFPLYLSDDSESLFGICQAMGGAFFDANLLNESSHTVAGKVPENSPIAVDSYFSFKRRALRPNAVQWYTLFSLSPLSPCLNPSWGKLVPPLYLRERLLLLSGGPDATRNPLHLERRNSVAERKAFSIYIVSPVRVKGLLLLRIKEGYRAKQYGLSTQDPDKVSIQFTLPLELGTVLHYELSYKAIDDRSPFVGVANVKIELSGERSFIQVVKNDFISNLAPAQKMRPSTIAMRTSAKLCKALRGMRREDCLQAYLCPLSWEDKLSTSDSPFARRLGTLSHLQRRKHFRLDQFDVLCIGRMPYEQGDYLILSEFIDFDSGEQELFHSLEEWSTQAIKGRKRYVKRTISSRDDLVAYCVIEVNRSGSTSRIFTLAVESFGGSSAVDRLALLSSLKEMISRSKDVVVLPKPMNDFLVGLRDPLCPELKLLRKQKYLESHFHHESWSGGPNPELLSLLTKRRNEVGKFWFLHSSDTYSLFAKLVTDDGERLMTADFTKPTDLVQVQYQIAVISGSIVIDMHVEREQGVFFTKSEQAIRFHELFDRVRVRDQECGRALSSRTSLLALLNDGNPASDQQANVERLLKYASRLSRDLRFFHSTAASANMVLEELTTQFMLSNPSKIQVKRLPIDVDATMGDVDSGTWFLIKFDGHTMGFAHLGSSDREERTSDSQPSFIYRELTFFSIGMSDLYAKRDLIADDDSADSHISEYLCVSEFADEIEENHGRNFARAAYLALRSDVTAQKVLFDASDFQYAVGHCRFVEFKAIALAKEIRDAESHGRDSSLFRAITDALTIVPGYRYCLFYNGDETQIFSTVNSNDSDTDTIDDGDGSVASEDHTERYSSDDGMDATNYRIEQHYYTASNHDLSVSSSDSGAEHRTFDIIPPIFVRFLIDDELIDLENDINRVDETATLKAQISIFDSSGTVSNFDDLDHVEVPEAHQVVVLSLRSLLDTYVAERLLERLRLYGDTVSSGDLKMAKQCLRKARKLSHDVDMQFYDAKSDSLTRPRAPSGSDTEINPVYSLFCSELQEDKSLKLTPTSPKGFFVMETEEDGSALSYWCFVTLKIHAGVVNVKLYHPEGKLKAAEAISAVLDHVIQTMHRFNQMLLLQSLHRNRIASSYLIGSDDFDEFKSDGQKEGSLFTPGSFACPVKFETSFSLYERCLPAQVVLSLEADVLHSFAVSNRRGVFVYKDESESIFYMKLKAVSGDDEASDSVELLVYGLRQPGPSVTVQLSRLLQRKVHMLAVDALSTVLTKNPHLKWKSSDLLFLQSFEESYPPADDEKGVSSSLKVVEYAVPEFLYDPIMLLIYFRQNICGSTYFHRLQQSTEVGSSRRDNTSWQAPPNIPKSNSSNVVPFDPNEFSIFYNNAPSPLDPEFQPVCTLTTKGAEYSRRTGTGVALIDVTLVTRGGQVVQELNVGQNSSEVEGVSLHTLDVSSLRFKKVNNDGDMPNYRILVSIADTALDREVLHSWIELSLNQVLIAWVVERYIERSQLGQRAGRRKLTDTAALCGAAGASCTKRERHTMIDKLEPGFPYLYDILDTSYGLPHPAIEKLEMCGVIKASSVASVALALLEKCWNGLFTRKCRERRAPELCGATIIRLSRTHSPTPVSLVWDSKHENALAKRSDSYTDSFIQDSPIDCPEYVCFYCFSHYSEDNKREDAGLPPSAMCFREVKIDDKSDGRNGIPFVDALLLLRERNPSAFSRSLVFVLSVKRNLRTLMAYNWNPQLWKSIVSQLKDANAAQRGIAHSSVYSLQKRCLQILSPEVTKHEPPSNRLGREENPESTPSAAKKEKAKLTASTKPVAESLGPRKTPARRIQRPTSIRRPKLIGKSVEGAAAQAMAASRARASANRGSSPFQKASKTSSKTKEHVGSDLEAAASNAVPSTAEPSSKDDKKHVPELGKDQRGSVAELSLLVKHYVSILSLTAASPFDHSRVVQSLIDKHWLLNPEYPLGPAAQNFLLTRSIKMWSKACEPIGFPDRMLMNVSGYFAQWLNMSNTEYNLLQLNAPSRYPSELSPFSTLVVELKRIYSRKLCVVLQTSLNVKGGSRALRLEAWMVLLPRVGHDVKPTKRRITRKSVSRFERDATLIDKKLYTFSTTTLEVHFFNFSSFLIEQSLNRWRESLSPVEMLPAVRAMIDKYPLERQMKMNGMQYAALEAPIVLPSYQNKLIDLYDSNKLFDYLVSNAGAHDMIVCNPDGLCFLNLIPVQETRSMCFLTRDHNVVGELQLVILTRLEGWRMDEFVFRKGNPIGIQMFDAVAIGGAAAARDVLQAAALNIRRDTLWTRFSSKTAKRGPSKEELCELLRLISSSPVADIDSRLPAILFDRGQEYGLDWRECLTAMPEDSLFSPHFTFDEKSHVTRNLFYMTKFDEFLSLSVNKDGILIEASLLWRDRNHESGSTIMAGQAFANYLVHYIWHHTI